MPYIQLYEDAACTNLYETVKTYHIEPETISAEPINAQIGGKTYSIFRTNLSALAFVAGFPSQIDILQTALSVSYKDRWSNGKTFYTKNGLQFTLTETNTIGRDCTVTNIYVNNTQVAGNAGSQLQVDTVNFLYLIDFTWRGKTYYGIPSYVRLPPDGAPYWYLVFCAEASFWEGTIRPPYNYGDGTDEDGGQGDGKIPHTDIPLSQTPQKVVPFGGHGLHAYQINGQAYNSIQGYLWGESSTIAKALWQKFQNKTHNPTSCIVGCYTLPAEFMPQSGTPSGVQLAGLLLTPISGKCIDVSQSIGFFDKIYTFGSVIAPFHSWLDYSGIQVIIRIPFCGVIQVAAEYCIEKNITLRYRVDQLNGNLVCIVYADGRVIAETSGNCAYNVPVSGGDDGTLQRLGAAVTGILQITAGNYAGALSSAAEAAGAVHQTQLVNSDMHGSMTACENRVPYIEWIYPTTAYTADYPNANGLPCEFSGTLGSFAGGYGEFEVMPASLNIPEATAAEKEEIASLLRGGVIV